MTSGVILVRAHAKINLALRVLGRRSDGYHELWTVFQALALHDTLACVACDGPFRIACAAPGVPLDEGNLVWRAAGALWRAAGRAGRPSGTVVHLKKRIPAQGGLGGGSADAASALVALAALWDIPVAREDLVALAGSIGADVPFFLTGGTALGTGRGDEIRPLPDMPHHWVVLLMPSFGVATGEAFGWWAARQAGEGDPAPVTPVAWTERAPVVNDLEAEVSARHPDIARMTAALRETGASAAAMTGSGSTVFGLFESRAAAHAAAVRLRGSGWRTVLTRFADAAACARGRRPVRRLIHSRP